MPHRAWNALSTCAYTRARVARAPSGGSVSCRMASSPVPVYSGIHVDRAGAQRADEDLGAAEPRPPLDARCRAPRAAARTSRRAGTTRRTASTRRRPGAAAARVLRPRGRAPTAAASASSASSARRGASRRASRRASDAARRPARARAATRRRASPARRASRRACRAARRARRASRRSRRRGSRPRARSCVTRSVVTPSSRRSAAQSACRSARLIASSAPNGSSMSSTPGRAAIARASATRCRCPPDSSCGKRAP